MFRSKRKYEHVFSVIDSMSSNFSLYIFCIVAIAVAIFFIKKVTSCLFKTIIFLILLAVLVYVAFTLGLF